MTQLYDWYYLCGNARRLALTLRYLPRDTPFEGLRAMKICYASHLDADHHHVELYGAVAKHAPSWLATEPIDLSAYVGLLPAGLLPYFDTGKPRWSLAMKLLFPLLCETFGEVWFPYLYTDDDVIVPNDPAPLMTNSFGSKGCFRFAGAKGYVAEQLFDAFNLSDDALVHRIDPPLRAWQRYDRAALDAGVWFQKYPDNWHQRLERFARMDYLADLTTSNLELRCLDQRFLTCFGIEHGWTPISIGQGFAPPRDGLRHAFFDKKTFFHYKSSQKQRWVDVLERHAKETGR